MCVAREQSHRLEKRTFHFTEPKGSQSERSTQQGRTEKEKGEGAENSVTSTGDAPEK